MLRYKPKWNQACKAHRRSRSVSVIYVHIYAMQKLKLKKAVHQRYVCGRHLFGLLLRWPFKITNKRDALATRYITNDRHIALLLEYNWRNGQVYSPLLQAFPQDIMLAWNMFPAGEQTEKIEQHGYDIRFISTVLPKWPKWYSIPWLMLLVLWTAGS